MNLCSSTNVSYCGTALDPLIILRGLSWQFTEKYRRRLRASDFLWSNLAWYVHMYVGTWLHELKHIYSGLLFVSKIGANTHLNVDRDRSYIYLHRRHFDGTATHARGLAIARVRTDMYLKASRVGYIILPLFKSGFFSFPWICISLDVGGCW
jgi:hypothetical protein